MIWVWIAVTVLALLIEIFTEDLVAIWFAVGGAIMTIVLAICPSVKIVWQVVIFLLISGALLWATRPLVKRFFARKEGSETNLELVLGHECRVIKAVSSEGGEVKVNGLVWSARANEPIEEGALVIVKKIEGNKLIVAKIEKVEE